jgi:hypothetical protein
MALAVTGFFAYRHFQRFQPSDAAPRSAPTSEAKDSTIPPVSGKLKVAPTAPATVVGASPPPAAPAPDRGVPAASQEKPKTVDEARTKGAQTGDRPGASPALPQAPAGVAAKPDADHAQPPRPEQKEPPKVSAVGTNGDVRQQPASVGADAPPRPQAPGKCTEAVAALGLCAQENTKGRKP